MKSGKSGIAHHNIADSHEYVAGWDGKPPAEPGWDSPGRSQRVSAAFVCE